MQDQRIFPNVWCNGNAEEVGAFYAAVIPDTTSAVESRYPSAGLLDFQQHMAGAVLTVAVTIGGTLIRLVNAGPEFRPNQSISFILNFDPLEFGGDAAAAQASLDATWAALAADGQILMPLGEYPFSPHYGWVEDRYGVSWQLMLTHPEGDPRPFVVPTLLFSGAAQNRAAEAIELYVGLFGEDAEMGARFPYGEPTGPATADALMFAEFRVGDQWIAAMDSGVPMDAPFGNGVSLQVDCADQEEIDRFWEALSTVPEAEMCGWLVDPFGVSWQIVPANMGELMERPNAYEHMMGMKKLIIADF